MKSHKQFISIIDNHNQNNDDLFSKVISSLVYERYTLLILGDNYGCVVVMKRKILASCLDTMIGKSLYRYSTLMRK